MSSRNRDSFNEINITPLTDIFLVLLIIMMVIAPLLDQQGLNLSVPDMVEQEQINKENKTLTVAVANDDSYVIDGQQLTVDQLEPIIKDKSKIMTDGLLIESAPDATHGAVVRLMDIARNSGVNNISMAEGS